MNSFDQPQPLRILHAPPVDADHEAWPDDDGGENDDDYSLDLDDEHWDALLADDDYEPAPEDGDFWTDLDAA